MGPQADTTARRASPELGEHGFDDLPRGHRQAAVVQDRMKLVLFHRGLERDQGLQLRVAILLNDEDLLVRRQESVHFAAERERADPHVVDRDAALRKDVHGLACRAVAAADRDQADRVGAGALDDRPGHQRPGPVELADQPVEHELVVGRVLGVTAVLVVSGAAGEVRALGRHARQRPVRDRVIVHVEVAVEFRQRLDLLLAEHLAAVGTVAVVPLQFGAHPVVHADVEVRQHEHRRLQPLGEVEGLHGQVEALLGIGGKISTCLVSPCEA
jgi:hypothetical protein